MIRILNLGAGLQSSILLLLSDRGELPKLDLAIFADTQYEPKSVYTHLEWLKTQVSIPIQTVTVGDIRQDTVEFRQGGVEGKRYANIPLFLKRSDGKRGKLRRQCTKEYKIEPIEKYIKSEILGLRPRQHWPKTPTVEQWFGITSDESRRMAFPGRWTKSVFRDDGVLFDDWKKRVQEKVWKPVRWRVNVYPFLNAHLLSDRTSDRVEYFPHTWTRGDCEDWVSKSLVDRTFPKSACICCPFRTNAEWRKLRDESPEEWNDAVEFDREIRLQKRDSRTPLDGVPYVHSDLIPLDMVDLSKNDGKESSSCGVLSDSCGGECRT